MDKGIRVSELLKIASGMDSARALLDWAQENGFSLTAQKAEAFYREAHGQTFGALSDEALEAAAGGIGIIPRCPQGKCKK